MLDFNCDRKAKDDWTASTASYLDNKWCSNASDYGYKFFESTTTGELVPYGDPTADIHSHMDLYLTLYKGLTPVLTYAIELKERWGRYVSTLYGEEGDDEGWMYNEEKGEYFEREIELGRIPVFSNLYPDNKITIWNLLRIPEENIHHMVKPIKKINIDPNSKKEEQARNGLMNKDGMMIDRINAYTPRNSR